MDVFLTSAKEADDMKSVNFVAMHDAIAAARTSEEGRELIAALMDAYYAADSPHAVYQPALMKAIGCCLRHAGPSLSDDDSMNRWQLTADDYILLALFFNELSTVDDTQLFSIFTEAVTLLFQQTVPIMYGAVGYDLSVDASTAESLCSELQTLRVMMAKRLTASPADSSTCEGSTGMQLGIIDCLRALLLSLMQAASTRANKNDTVMKARGKEEGEDVNLAVRQAVEGILSPLRTAVDAVRSSASGGSSEKSSASIRVQAGTTVSPLVLTSALHVLEEILWRCARHVTPHDVLEKTVAETPLIVAARLAVTRVLGALQQYLLLQQQQSMESAAGSIEKGSLAVDVLRTAGVQWAVRRLLSVVRLHLHLFPSMGNAVLAALNAFGGSMEMEDPFQLMRMRRECETALYDENNNGDHNNNNGINSNNSMKDVALRKAWEVATVSSSSSSDAFFLRIRECEQILEAPHEETTGTDGATADLGDLDDATLLQGDGGGGGSREALLQSTVGPVSVNALVEMVLLSVRHMDIMTEQAIQALHTQGLERMQYEAAKRAQREEILRQRRIEQQGVEGIPVGRLLEHLKESTALYAKGTHLLESESALAMVLRSAFFSLLDAYDGFLEETESRVLEAQALIARALVQLPPSMIDAAMDAVCVRLRKEFSRRAHDKTASLPLHSAYQLAMQVLFTLFSMQAPVLERGTTAFAFLTATNSMTEAELQLPGSSMKLRSHAAFTIDTENPVEWLQSTTHDAAGGLSNRKRLREEETTVQMNVDESGEEGVENGVSYFFREDTMQSPCMYSYFLCRVVELVTEAELPALLLDVLLQCPCITRYAWHYIHKHYCLSTEKSRCLLGMWLLKSLAIKRTVYRRYAVNSLLHLAATRNEYPRRLAVTKLGELLSATGADGRRVIDTNAETLLVRYAKRQMAAIPVTKLPSSTTLIAAAVNPVAKMEGANTNHDEGGTASLRDKEMRKLADALDRHLGPFLMLCARQPKELFPALLAVFKECVERQNEAMMHLLAEHVDVRRMCQRLFRMDAMSFMSNVMPYLRRHSSDATVLVQKILWAICSELRAMGQATEPSASQLERTALALLGHARVMYESSEIPQMYPPSSSTGGVGDATVPLHDVRFISPFLSLLSAEELKRTYLRSFLHFVQLQLQLQLQQQQQQQLGSDAGMNATAEATRINSEELEAFIRDVVREVLVRSPVHFSDGIARGLSRTDLLVYMHFASHDSHAADFQVAAGKNSTVSVSRGREELRGILGAGSSSTAATEEAARKKQTAEYLTISPLTTKRVIAVLLKLTRTFDGTTTEFLYGPEEIKSAVRQVMQQLGGIGGGGSGIISSSVSSVPPQLMVTLILACKIHAQRPHADLVRFVHHVVLLPLAKDATWEKDTNLWRGVLLFAEEHYRECSSFLVNLPEKVLIQALRSQPQLREYFREEHGNNAAFGHILGSL
ncbi:hypothetical protein MOQ_001589 [Trypanosoma cruzi marinkellei]|uniref:Symplekin C-terminal domain-containing protein n=1 Tax=Trypanosoma cruzi marinkellei TaxID=85056 RepID=K2MSE4_TRYCR|nr:hypothetical protein MOQ_001589 [Trypanosoma cruzi marinkellei]